MKKHYASILLTLICLTGLGVSARAEGKREIIVTVPYEFVAGGKTLPAGSYTVSHVNDQRNRLIISSYENHSIVIVSPIEFNDQLAGNAKVIFEQVGDLHILSKIETLDGVYTLPEPRPVNIVAGAKQHQGMSASGTN
jgi:hypothetical protein